MATIIETIQLERCSPAEIESVFARLFQHCSSMQSDARLLLVMKSTQLFWMRQLPLQNATAWPDRLLIHKLAQQDGDSNEEGKTSTLKWIGFCLYCSKLHQNQQQQQHQPRTVQIEEIFVVPEHRRQRVGSKLIQHCIDQHPEAIEFRAFVLRQLSSVMLFLRKGFEFALAYEDLRYVDPLSGRVLVHCYGSVFPRQLSEQMRAVVLTTAKLPTPEYMTAQDGTYKMVFSRHVKRNGP